MVESHLSVPGLAGEVFSRIQTGPKKERFESAESKNRFIAELNKLKARCREHLKNLL